MDITIPENLGKELDKLLVPVLGDSFQIKRNHHGVYVLSAHSGHVVTIHASGHAIEHEYEFPKRKTC